MYNIAIVGAKNSGKTTLIELLIEHLTKQGFNCMSKKHTSHHHAFDSTGKDSDRHRKAGAILTIATNPGEFAIFSKQNESLQKKINQILDSEFDVCIIEGDKFSKVDKILLTRNISEIDSEKIEDIIASYGSDDTKVTNNHFDTESIESLVTFITVQSKKQITAGEIQ